MYPKVHEEVNERGEIKQRFVTDTGRDLSAARISGKYLLAWTTALVSPDQFVRNEAVYQFAASKGPEVHILDRGKNWDKVWFRDVTARAGELIEVSLKATDQGQVIWKSGEISGLSGKATITLATRLPGDIPTFAHHIEPELSRAALTDIIRELYDRQV